MRNKIITSVFCLLLAVGVLSGFFVPDKYYSESEKRTLTQKDAISISDFPSGKMGTEIEKYLSDQFRAAQRQNRNLRCLFWQGRLSHRRFYKL